jgi:carbonic anhydrase
VESLKVKHVVVLGHYGCGGVAESMKLLPEQPIPPADIAVQGWIYPIREIYQTSTRPEIAAHREKHRLEPLKSLPGLHDPAFRALVEENVKSNVQKIANSAVIRDHYVKVVTTNGSSQAHQASSTLSPQTTAALITEVFIHGWVYDVETGKVSDLGVSVGPPGREVPTSPFPLLRT